MKKALTALAFGTFGLGVAEYVMMGILPYLATDFRITIPQAGYFISAYALGVCFGAPLVAVVARTWPLKRILYLLCSIMVVSTLAMSLCPVPGSGSGLQWQFWLMILFRFCAGIPHGSYFGVGSIVADRLSKDGKATIAVAIMTSGMTIANLVGIPLGTLLTSMVSWRVIFAISCVWDIFTLVSIMRWIPEMSPLPNTGFKGTFRFLKTLAPWLIIMATVFGNGGIFCWYSYITPTLTQLSGVPIEWLTFMMILAGAGMVIGNLLGGELSDRYGPGVTGRGLDITIFITLCVIALFADMKWVLIPCMVVACGCLFAVSSPQQLLLLRFSKGGELMGGAMVQLAFNLGNALGAYFGGLPIVETNPMTYHYPAAIGAVMALGGIICYVVFCKKYAVNA